MLASRQNKVYGENIYCFSVSVNSFLTAPSHNTGKSCFFICSSYKDCGLLVVGHTQQRLLCTRALECPLQDEHRVYMGKKVIVFERIIFYRHQVHLPQMLITLQGCVIEAQSEKHVTNRNG